MSKYRKKLHKYKVREQFRQEQSLGTCIEDVIQSNPIIEKEFEALGCIWTSENCINVPKDKNDEYHELLEKYGIVGIRVNSKGKDLKYLKKYGVE